MSLLYQSTRHFQVWRYSVSHRVLLLRSAKDDLHHTRIDVVFGQVSRMLLEPDLDGLEIIEADGGRRDDLVSKVGGVFRGGLYLLDGEGRNFVVSGPPAWHEDEGSYRDPSFFEQMLML
ncbi:hypothetical protein [Krasilnikovia sp. MM14-A1259]|uniref:hypothetical protein n=1 Tax=Krasilnikovia sp. MM14-A1259 TaxID=3373539 RepID=UPI0037FE35C3